MAEQGGDPGLRRVANAKDRRGSNNFTLGVGKSSQKLGSPSVRSWMSSAGKKVCDTR